MNRMIRPSDCGDLLEDGLEPLLELAAELGPGDQGAHVQRDHPALLQALGHVAGDDPLGQALDDRRLAHARLADQDRVVLGPPAEDLDDPADLRIPADDRVHLPLAGQLDEVAAVALQRLVLVLGVLVGHPLAAADLLERLEDLLLGDPQGPEQGLRPALDLHQGQQQVLDRDVLVLHPLGLGGGGLEDLVQLGADRLLAAGDLGQRVEPLLGRLEDLRRVDAELAQERADDLLVGVAAAPPAGASAPAADARARGPATGPAGRLPGSSG